MSVAAAAKQHVTPFVIALRAVCKGVEDDRELVRHRVMSGDNRGFGGLADALQKSYELAYVYYYSIRESVQTVAAGYERLSTSLDHMGKMVDSQCRRVQDGIAMMRRPQPSLANIQAIKRDIDRAYEEIFNKVQSVLPELEMIVGVSGWQTTARAVQVLEEARKQVHKSLQKGESHPPRPLQPHAARPAAPVLTLPVQPPPVGTHASSSRLTPSQQTASGTPHR